MKATLAFDLPEEREELEVALRALKAEGVESVLGEIDETLRSILKYGYTDETLTDKLTTLRALIHDSGLLGSG